LLIFGKKRKLDFINWFINLQNEELIFSIEKFKKQHLQENKAKTESSSIEKMIEQEKQQIDSHSMDLNPLSKTDLIRRARASEEDIKNGRFIDLEDLEKEMEKW